MEWQEFNKLKGNLLWAGALRVPVTEFYIDGELHPPLL